MRPCRGIDRRDGESKFNASPARVIVHGLVKLVMQALAQTVRCRRNNGATCGTADRLHGTVIPARGADGAHDRSASRGSQGATLPGVVQGAKALPRIQTAHGWEGVEGRGSPPLVVM